MNNSIKRLTLPIMLPLILLSVSCGSTLYTMDMKMRRMAAGLEEKSVEIEPYTISYLESGPGETGETVLLLHGFGADKDNWLRCAKYLKGTYRVIAPDLPGFGKSTRIMNESYDNYSQVHRIHRFAAKIGLQKFHIAGNSMGGLISGLYAAEYPENVLSLGLLDPGGVTDRETSRLTIELDKGNNPLVVSKAEDYTNLIDFVFTEPPFMPGNVKRYLGEIAVKSKDFYDKVFVEAAPGDLLEKRMKDIRARTLIIWGDQDLIFPASSGTVLDSGIQNSKLVVLKNCGHVPMIERPKETAQYYIEYLK